VHVPGVSCGVEVCLGCEASWNRVPGTLGSPGVPEMLLRARLALRAAGLGRQLLRGRVSANAECQLPLPLQGADKMQLVLIPILLKEKRLKKKMGSSSKGKKKKRPQPGLKRHNPCFWFFARFQINSQTKM